MTVLPELTWKPTAASDSRNGATVELVVVHRWGVRVSAPKDEAVTAEGVVNFFSNPANRASAHIVYPGSVGTTTQMVAWQDMAWAEAAYNPEADEVESADDIWVLGPSGTIDEAGLEQLARIVAFRLHVRGLPAVWSTKRGFCRHADLGQAGGGHLECPTTDIPTWRKFVSLVQKELERGGFRTTWGH